jgi:regulator of protease activity HflC (stomatin/prohibitin superfamily)
MVMNMLTELTILSGVIVAVVAILGIRTVRPIELMAIERLGKYNRTRDAGITWVVPFIEHTIKKNTTEQLVDVEPQEVITVDNLNAMVDAQIYFKIKRTEEGLKAALYNVNAVEFQIVNLARTTLRNQIGNMKLTEVNSERTKINSGLQKTLIEETKNWGIDIVRTELKEVRPPPDVQETMNAVVKANNTKIAAIDLATATETQADGRRRAAIKEAEGVRQATILEAEGQAKAFDLINKSFKGNAQMNKRLDVTQASLQNNTKVIVPQGSTLVIGESGGIIPIKNSKESA